MTIALARRYRPKRFEDLLVQDHVAAALRGAVARNRVGHGYLLTGPRGVGKTTAARILAMALNCERRGTDAPPGEPCAECQSCERIWSGGTNLDVVEIDAASNRGVDDARDLRERAMYAASQAGHHKVYIVDEAHMLTREAWNALLKILEEPPPGVVFVFATTEPQKIANTAAPVMSRLQRFDFRRIGPAAIKARLVEVLAAEGLSAEDDALLLIAKHADGGMRDALSVLDQCLSFGEGPVSAERVREALGLIADEIYAEVLQLVAARDASAVFPLVDRLMEAGADLTEFMNGSAEMLRALLMTRLGAVPEDLTEGLRQAITTVGAEVAAEDVLRMLRLLAESEAAIRRSASPRLTIETLLLRWTMLDRIIDLEQVLAAGSGSVSPAASTPSRATPPSTPTAERVPATGRRRGTSPGPSSPPPPAPSATSDAEESPEVDPGPMVRAPFTVEGLQGVWQNLVAAARTRSMFLGQALASARPVAVNRPELTLALGAEDEVLRQALERQRDVAEGLVTDCVGEPVRLKVVLGSVDADKGGTSGGGGGGDEGGGRARPKRLSNAGLRAEHLEELRGQDPALDAAVDELDLEIVDEA